MVPGATGKAEELLALNVATASAAPGTFPALVLNADFRPLSYYPLSLWAGGAKAVFLDRVNIVSNTGAPPSSSRSAERGLARTYPARAIRPFTRFNVFLRDVYLPVLPRRPGPDLLIRAALVAILLENVTTACAPCNLMRRGCRAK
jgi:hypothetical protein